MNCVAARLPGLLRERTGGPTPRFGSFCGNTPFSARIHHLQGTQYGGSQLRCMKELGPGKPERVYVKELVSFVHTSNTNFVRGQDKKHLSVFNSISLASGDGAIGGDDSDFVHYRTELVPFGLNMLSASGRLPSRVPIVRRKRARTEVFGQRPRRYERPFNFNWNEAPNPPGQARFIHPGPYLNVGTGQSQLPGTCELLTFVPSSFDALSRVHAQFVSPQQKLRCRISKPLHRMEQHQPNIFEAAIFIIVDNFGFPSQRIGGNDKRTVAEFLCRSAKLFGSPRIKLCPVILSVRWQIFYGSVLARSPFVLCIQPQSF